MFPCMYDMQVMRHDVYNFSEFVTMRKHVSFGIDVMHVKCAFPMKFRKLTFGPLSVIPLLIAIAIHEIL